MMAAAAVAAAAEGASSSSSSSSASSSSPGEWEAASRALRALAWLGQEFLSDWEAQDLRAALFQLLLLWLVVSLLGIQVAWRVYGNTVTGLYYRQGPGGQNGGTPDGSSHFPMWEGSTNETVKTHRE